MSENEKRSRYPGLVPFNEQQGSLFFGREKEKAELYNFIVAEQTIVLFAKSGAGKSSLLHAGLFPLLRANGYHPVKVRFQYTVEYDEAIPGQEQVKQTPLKILFDTLEQRSQDKDDAISINKEEILYNKTDPKLWEYLKVIQLPSVVVQAQPVLQEEVAQAAQPGADGNNAADLQFRAFTKPKREIKQTPVLVFDQFEEFFNFPENERHEFMTQLCEVLHNLCPNRMSQWLRGFKLSERTPEMMEWVKQPVVKCIIAIRDDKLSELDSLRRYIPLILKNRYKLSPLNMDNARQAMEQPALLDGDFRSPKFSFHEPILLKILSCLSGNDTEEKMIGTNYSATAAKANEITSQNDKGIDGSQLQKVCSYIERKVILQADKKKNIVVDKNFINPDEDIQIILDSFYEAQLKTLGSAKDISICKNLIEERLVSGGARASLTENQMNEHLKNRRYLIEKMINARLIKEEYTHLGKTYELSHDTLVKSVARFARDVKSRRQRKYVIFFSALSILSILSLVAAIILGNKVYRSLNANNLQLAEAYYQQNNHYVAFDIWDDFLNRNFVSASKKDSIKMRLDSLFFFDISGGKKLVRLSDSLVAVHENDNTIHVWSVPSNKTNLHVKTLDNAYNMEVSDSKRYLGYRTAEGKLMIYDIKRDTIFSINEAVGSTVENDQRVKIAREADFKMNFLRGADLIGYIDTAGEVYLYNLDDRRKVRLRIRKIEDAEFYSDFIVSRIKVSQDKKFLAIHKKDSFAVWNIQHTEELPFRIYTEKNMTTAYFYANGNSVCYQKNDSLIIIPFESFSGSLAGYRTRIVGYPDFAPGLKKVMFYNKKYELIVFDLEKNRTDTVLRDYNSAHPSRRRVASGSSMRAQWVDGDDRITYYDSTLQEVILSLEQKREVPELSTYSSDGKFYCWLKSSGLLRVYDRQTAQVIYTDTLHLDSTAIADMIGTVNIGNEVLRFSSTGNMLAYQVRNGKTEGYLKIVSLPDGNLVYQSRDLWTIGEFFTDKMIAVHDAADNPGLIFLPARERKADYFRNLYPKLTRQDRKRLGVNHFIDIF